jgi:OsmC subfamily peroxiredoxin
LVETSTQTEPRAGTLPRVAAAGEAAPAGADRAALSALARRLAELRRDRGLRLVDVATLSGLSEAFLSRIESGDRWPSLRTLFVLARSYGVETSALLTARSLPEHVALHHGDARWDGGEATGSGVMSNGSTHIAYDLDRRLAGSSARTADQDAEASSPEELVGMAIAGCYSMSLTRQLAAAGFEPVEVRTEAEVVLAAIDSQFSITEIRLACRARVPAIDAGRFDEIAQLTRRECVVSRALAAVSVTVEATLDLAVDEGSLSRAR